MRKIEDPRYSFRSHSPEHASTPASPAPLVKAAHDCFARGSMVLTPNGERRIETLRIGDVVTTPSGMAKVENIVQGFERDLVFIEAEDGRSIRVTRDHPMMTDRGLLRADELRFPDRMMTPDKPVAIRSLWQERYDDAIYNLNVGGGRLIVNGFVTGDFMA